MKPIGDLKNSKNLMALFVGLSGSSKSTAGASFGATGPYVNCDFDKRARGIMDAVNQKFINGENVFVEDFDPKGNDGFPKWNKFLETHLSHHRAGVMKLRTIQVSSLFSFSRMLKNASKQAFGGGMKLKVGKDVILTLDGQTEFNTEISGTHESFDTLRMLPCNIILDAHIVPRWGRVRYNEEGNPVTPLGEEITTKEQLEAAQRSSNEVIGWKINARPEYAESVISYFDNVFMFSKEVVGKSVAYKVEFTSDIAKNTFGLKPKEHDITGVSFFEYFKKLTGWEG